jgi:hypothetical protein
MHWMPCTGRCGARRMVQCARGNAHASLGVPWHARRGQSGGQGKAYERPGWQTSIGRAGWW